MPVPVGSAELEVDVAGTGQSSDVRGVHLGQRTAHPQGVADRGQEQRFGERRLDEVVGARIDAGGDGVECPAFALGGASVRAMTGMRRLAGSARIRRHVSMPSRSIAPMRTRTASG